MSKIKLIPLLSVALVALMSVEAHAGLFSSGHLFTAKTLKLPRAEEFIKFGIAFSIAPVKAIAREAVDQIKEQNPEATQYIEMAEHVDLEEFKDIDIDSAKAEFKDKVPNLTPEQEAQIDQLEQDDLDSVIQLAELVQSADDAITFAFEPFFRVTPLDFMELGLHVPLAGFFVEEETDFSLGNITIDAKFGSNFGGGGVGAGIAGGVELFLPTGTERSNSVALSNLLMSPKYLHEYMTISPYVVAGADLLFVNVQAYAQLHTMLAVKGEPTYDQMMYLQWGASAAVTPTSFITISAELAGLSEISDAPAFSGMFMTAGFKLNFFGFQPGAAIQFPIFTEDESAMGSAIGGGNFGSPASWNLMISVAMAI